MDFTHQYLKVASSYKDMIANPYDWNPIWALHIEDTLLELIYIICNA